jgi:toxin ParE1/3/4
MVAAQRESLYSANSATRYSGELPNRGVYPKELAEAGIKDFREVFFKPYRIIYEVGKKGVYVHLVADGRRNIQALLKRRLLGG